MSWESMAYNIYRSGKKNNACTVTNKNIKMLPEAKVKTFQSVWRKKTMQWRLAINTPLVAKTLGHGASFRNSAQ